MVLGIDTSCYTTSLAVAENGEILCDERIVLDVKNGQCGLRQSEGVFKHVKNFPVLTRRAGAFLPHIQAVCVSSTPRRSENSYMPVFTVGMGYAQAIADALGVKIYFSSHQEGHISAAAHTAKFDDSGRFVAVHISGGTTEILICEKDGLGYKTQICGKTLDISAGQFIDRIGVLGGEDFPCGAAMDAAACCGDIKLPVSVKGGSINLSGAETQAKRLFTPENKNQMYYAVFRCIGESLAAAIADVCADVGADRVLTVGGVASNSVIRKILTDKFKEKICFSKPKYSTDNAVGTAFLAEKRWKNDNR